MSDNPVLIAREGQLSGQRWTIDADDFVNHCIRKYGDANLETWTMEALKKIVEEFISLIEPTGRPSI